MSSLFPAALLLMPGTLPLVPTQDVYGPEAGFEGDPDTPQSIVEEAACEEGLREDGTIVVCRAVDDAERYMSPLPQPVDPQIRILPGFEPPPCENHLLSFCGRFGGSSQPPLLVDLSLVPESLSAEEQALVTRADSAEENEPPEGAEEAPDD